MRWSAILLGGGLFLHAASGVIAQTASSARTVWVAELRGTIDPATADFLVQSIQKAQADHAQALIVELDTPGGLVTSVREMAQAVQNSQIPVIVYVSPAGSSATSAGALLAFASHVSAMAPGTHLGAAHPVDSGGKDIPGAMGEKAVNDTAAFARSLAELRGRNSLIAEAVVTKSRSLTVAEAIKSGVVEISAESRKDLLKQLDGREVLLGSGQKKKLATAGADLRFAEMTLGQKILHVLANPNIATLLMTLGMICLYVEISTPGLQVAGILGIISIMIAFISFQMLPIRMGGLALLALGIAFLAAEPFVASHGALALGGTIALVLGFLWIIDPASGDLSISPMIWIPVVITLGGGAMLAGLVAIRTRLKLRQVEAQIGGRGKSGLAGYRGHVESVSSDGHGGKALFRGELWDFESTEPVSVGQAVEVVKVSGFKVFVKGTQ